MKKIKVCKNCIYGFDEECFYFSIKKRWDEAIKIAKNHKALSEKLNKKNDCQYHEFRNFKYYIKKIWEILKR